MSCIFCKLVNGEIESAKFWENEYYIAVLDIFPNVKGMALVITKKHYPSDIFDQMPNSEYIKFFDAANEIIKILKTGLNVHRVALVVEGLGINHAHIKLYPLHGLTQNFQEMWGAEHIYFEKYHGYISTQLGPKADINELKKLADVINHKG
ncbi:MAG: Histidine triad (HIT) protein [candidate division TM6 bacterium GW2011_GWF2_37_49]|nr:MAG: Histidine triad (HIT) protein [candidate division TM6 bacterium GW2011_GWF2_37_49]